MHSSMDKSTSNLIRHVNTCSPSTSSASTPSVSNYSVGQFRYLIATWSACHAWPHSIIEDVELHEILIMLNAFIKIHSHQTISQDISDMYHCSCLTIALHLQSVKHQLHIALDGWTSPNVFLFLGVMVQYFEKGDICGFMLDFVKYNHRFHFTFSLWLRHCD